MDYGKEWLFTFLQKASEDCRLTKSHLALYISLKCLSEIKQQQPLRVYARDIMHLSKISSSSTYIRIVQDLEQYGYIDYKPCHYKRMGCDFKLNI